MLYTTYILVSHCYTIVLIFICSLLTSVYSAEFLPALSHAVTLLLNMAEHECSRQLRTKSMICLKEAAQLNRQSAVSGTFTPQCLY